MPNIIEWSSAGNNKLSDYIRYNSYRSERYKLLYVATPKVACTSIKWWFATLEGHAEALHNVTDSIETDPDLVIHDAFHKVAPNVTHLKLEVLSEALASDQYFRFAVVRNPYKRLFSAWQSKLLLREPYQIGPYLRCDFFQHPIECLGDIALAFEGFLEHLAANEAPTYWNVHWAPQATLLNPELVNYTKVVKIEDANELRQALAAHLGENIPDPLASRHTNESIIPYLPEFVTARSAELIRILYAKDFDIFEYDKQPPTTKDSFTNGQFKLAFKAIALIRGRHQRLGERNGLIIKLNQTVTERDGRVANLTRAVSEHDTELAAYQTQVEEFVRHVSGLQANLTAAEGEIARRDNELRAYHTQAEEFARHVSGLQANLTVTNGEIALLASTLKQTRAQRELEILSWKFLANQMVALFLNLVRPTNKNR